jgi:serine/threonine-protein kinase
MVGTEIGNYRILEKLGEGGMGVVYKAVDVNLDRTVAMKGLNIDLSGNPDLEQRFRAEVKALANLNHPNLTPLQGLLIDKGRPWMIMEFIDGGTFQQLVQLRGPLSSEVAIRLLRPALSGIGYAHQMGVLHGDIKPGNIMLNRQSVVKVMDLGVARALSAGSPARTGAPVGTPFYMSPEQFLNRGVDARSDIYSLGVTLYEILTGRVPFGADNHYQVMADHVNTPPAPLTQLNPGIPPGVERVVLKALEKNPDARYRSVEEFGAALENSQSVFGPAPVVSPPPLPVPGAFPTLAAAVPVAAAGVVAAAAASQGGTPAKPSSPGAISRLFATKQRKIIAAGSVGALALAGALLLAIPRLRHPAAPAQAAATAAPAQAAANDASKPSPAPDGTTDANQAASAQAQPDASAGANAAAPAQPDGSADGGDAAAVQPDGGAAVVAVPAGGLIIPVGTVVAVRLVDGVSSSANQAGDRFSAVVVRPVVVGGAVAIPAGAPARVVLANLAQAPAAVRTVVQLELVRLGGYHTQTSIFERASKPRGKHKLAAFGGAALGALGGILSHNGATAGAAAGAAGQFVVIVPPQTRIDFTLRGAIAVTP